MQSTKKTPVAVLRHEIGLTVEEFAELIGKSVSAVNSLETGRLALSEETARTIAVQTGVALSWLLNGNAKQKPYRNYTVKGTALPYTRDYFEEVQYARGRKLIQPKLAPLAPELRLWPALNAICQWISVHHRACEDGDGEFACYLMRKAIEPLIERFGKDDKVALEANKYARITLANGDQFGFRDFNGLGITLVPSTIVDDAPKKQRVAKSSPLPPSPGYAHRASGRKFSSPERRRLDGQASG
jgi:transcriptional regulator with XRE-family HTH domain